MTFLNSNQSTLELVAVMIRGSVLFYSVAVWMPIILSVHEFWYLYGVDSMKVRILFLLLKNVPLRFMTMKKYKNKVELQRYRFYWYLSHILAIKLGDLFDH